MRQFTNKMLVSLTLFSFHFIFAQDEDPCACEPKVGSVRPYRIEAKWDTAFSQYALSKRVIKSYNVRRWEKKYANLAGGSTVSWNTKRLANIPEDSLYTLEGYLWFVKAEVDCDYHIQIGPRSKTSMRAVVEVTIKNCDLQKEIRDTLRARGYAGSLETGIELNKGIPVTVVGLGFYDWQHHFKTPPADTPGDSPLRKQSGTAWEIHPVQSIKFR